MTPNPLTTLAFSAADWLSCPLPAAVEHHARRAVLDWFAALLPGCADGPALLMAPALAAERGAGRAVCYVDGGLGAPRHAAMLNGIASHTAEFDDIFRDGGYHPGSPTISAALAVAQDQNATQDQFLRAVIGGFEVGCRIAMALQPSHYRNWHITATVGTIGAAVSTAMLRGGTAETIAHAIAIALDRQEMATEVQADGSVKDVPHSAVQYVRNTLGLQVCAIAQLTDLLHYLQTRQDAPGGDPEMAQHSERVRAYRDRYGVH